jgi:hypothetical protein
MSRYRNLRNPERFAATDVLCVFIGHVKSGGSLLGAMLAAHPDALVSDEVGVLKYLEAGFSREQIFHLIEKGSRREAVKDRVTARRLEPYSLAVPDMYQGRSEHVRVVGDTRAGPTTRLLGDEPALLDELVRMAAPSEVRFIHVVRDPRDPIAAMMRRGKRTFANAMADYESQCHRLVKIRERVSPARVLTVDYETLIGDPSAGVASACDFLGLARHDDHLAACARLVDPHRDAERTWVAWPDESSDALAELIASVPFLERYGQP